MREKKFVSRLWENDGPMDDIISIGAIDPADGERFKVCMVLGIDKEGEHDERSEANAHLISAAPELLEALEMISNELTSVYGELERMGNHDHDYQSIAEADAVIAKAYGTKLWACDGCGNVNVEVDKDYQPQGCCDGRECGCMGQQINPVFCTKCHTQAYGEKPC